MTDRKTIPGYETFALTQEGRVIKRRSRKPAFLWEVDGHLYCSIRNTTTGKRDQVAVAVLMLKVFKGIVTSPQHIKYKDGNHENLNLENLEELVLVPEFPRYTINRQGHIHNLKTGRKLEGNMSQGRLVVQLRRDGKRNMKSVAGLVLLAFEGYVPSAKESIVHLDGNLKNCALSNLDLESRSKKRQATKKRRGTDKKPRKLRKSQVLDIVEAYRTGFGVQEIGESYEVSAVLISNILKGRVYQDFTGLTELPQRYAKTPPPPPAEQWVEVVDFPNYQVSNLGNVMSYAGRSPRPLKGGMVRKIKTVQLCDGGTTRSVTRARLVLEHFGGKPPQGKDMVGYHDGNQQNYYITNLYWASQRRNAGVPIKSK